MNEDEFNEAFGDDEIDFNKVALEAAVVPIVTMYRALRKQGLSIEEAACIVGHVMSKQWNKPHTEGEDDG